MQRASDTGNHVTDELAFGEFLRKVEERIAAREAANPTPEPPPEPWVGKTGTLIAAEKDVWRWEMVHKLRLVLCGGPEKCKEARCRRARRCAAIEEIRPEIEAARATLARELAKWTPPPVPPEPPMRRRGRKTK
jgi:hypothetical protein